MGVMMMTVLCVFLAFMAVSVPYTNAGPAGFDPCQKTNQNFYLVCSQYLWDGGVPLPKCCDGLKKLNADSTTPQLRQAACLCIRGDYARYPANYKIPEIKALPGKCGVGPMPYIERGAICDQYVKSIHFFISFNFLTKRMKLRT